MGGRVSIGANRASKSYEVLSVGESSRENYFFLHFQGEGTEEEGSVTAHPRDYAREL